MNVLHMSSDLLCNYHAPVTGPWISRYHLCIYHGELTSIATCGTKPKYVVVTEMAHEVLSLQC